MLFTKENLYLVNLYKDKVVSGLSYSQAAVKNPELIQDSCEFRYRFMWDCYSSLFHLRKFNVATIYWALGHSGIEGSQDCMLWPALNPSLGSPEAPSIRKFNPMLRVNMRTFVPPVRSSDDLIGTFSAVCIGTIELSRGNLVNPALCSAGVGGSRFRLDIEERK